MIKEKSKEAFANLLNALQSQITAVGLYYGQFWSQYNIYDQREFLRLTSRLKILM